MFGQQTVSSTRRGNVGCISEPTSGSQSHECVCFYCNILFSERRSMMLTLRGLHTLAKRACWFISAAWTGRVGPGTSLTAWTELDAVLFRPPEVTLVFFLTFSSPSWFSSHQGLIGFRYQVSLLTLFLPGVAVTVWWTTSARKPINLQLVPGSEKWRRSPHIPTSVEKHHVHVSWRCSCRLVLTRRC